MWVERTRRVCCAAITIFIILQIVSWASVSSRPFPHEAAGPGQSSKSLQVQEQSKEGHGQGLVHGREEMEAEEVANGLGSVGSRPPNCARKCGGCTPCEAMQVPTTTHHVGPLYANYEPEGWKCKCGASLFNP